MPSSSKSSGQLGAEARARAGNGGGNYGGASVTGNRFGAPSASTQAAAAQRNAATNGMFGGQGGLNARRTQNQTPSYEMNLHNMVELGKFAVPGPGLVMGAGKMVAGYGPDFTGYQGQVNGPGDYDPKDRPFGGAGLMGSGGFNGAMLPSAYAALQAQQQGQQQPHPAGPAAAAPPVAQQGYLPPQWLSNTGPGLMPYGAGVPGLNYSL